MRRFSKKNCIRVISEPGDATRYDYTVIKDIDDYYFVGTGNDFKYPYKFNFFDARHLNSLEDCVEHIKRDDDLKDVNPYTLLECVRCIKDMSGSII